MCEDAICVDNSVCSTKQIIWLNKQQTEKKKEQDFAGRLTRNNAFDNLDNLGTLFVVFSKFDGQQWNIIIILKEMMFDVPSQNASIASL